jgi:hypothetical protein
MISSFGLWDATLDNGWVGRLVGASVQCGAVRPIWLVDAWSGAYAGVSPPVVLDLLGAAGMSYDP